MLLISRKVIQQTKQTTYLSNLLPAPTKQNQVLNAKNYQVLRQTREGYLFNKTSISSAALAATNSHVSYLISLVKFCHTHCISLFR